MEALNHSINYIQKYQRIKAEHDMEGNIRLAKDEVQFIAIFPPEIWELISEYLTDSETHNLCNVLPSYRKLLFQKRKLFLFRSALQHLVPYLARNEDEEGTSSTILDCRVVCQTWKKAVDWYVGDAERACKIMKFITHFEEMDTLHNAQIKEFSNHEDDEDDDDGRTIENFLDQFQVQAVPSRRMNPFIGRTLDITYKEELDQNNYYMKAITTLLHRFGCYINRLQIHLCGGNLTSKSYSALIQWLHHVGNVQFLEVKCKFMDDTLPNLDLPISSIPKFHNLKSLELGRLPKLLVKNLVWENYQNLSKLKLQQEIPHLSDKNVVFPPFKNLKEFGGYILSWDQMLKELEIVNHCKLQSLELYKCNDFDIVNQKVNSDAVTLTCFEILKLVADKWGNTLETLDLNLPNQNTADLKLTCLQESANLRLNFQRLHSFDLKLAGPIHLDFLLGAKNSLKRVYIQNYDPVSPVGQVVSEDGLGVGTSLVPLVQFSGYEHRMYESNIWTMFPNISAVFTFPNGVPCCFRRSGLTQQIMYNF